MVTGAHLTRKRHKKQEYFDRKLKSKWSPAPTDQQREKAQVEQGPPGYPQSQTKIFCLEILSRKIFLATQNRKPKYFLWKYLARKYSWLPAITNQNILSGNIQTKNISGYHNHKPNFLSGNIQPEIIRLKKCSKVDPKMRQYYL